MRNVRHFDWSALGGRVLLAATLAACAAPAPVFVSALAETPPRRPTADPGPPGGPRDGDSGARPKACERAWSLGDVADGAGRVLVVCGSDIRREPLEESGRIARMLAPGLEPARERVCACIERLGVPPFVDLVFTARPDTGRVTVEGSEMDDLDPGLGPPFIACIGKVVARFEASPSDACSGGAGQGRDDKAVIVYPARVDLGEL